MRRFPPLSKVSVDTEESFQLVHGLLYVKLLSLIFNNISLSQRQNL